MRIEKISAKNFRTLEDIEIEFNSTYCTISGHNDAGKSSIIRVLTLLFGDKTMEFLPWGEQRISYEDDKTKWVKGDDPIELASDISLKQSEDSAITSYMERLLSKSFSLPEVKVSIKLQLDKAEERSTELYVDGEKIERLKARDILQKLKSIDPLLVHNSTRNQDGVFFRSRPLFHYQLALTPDRHKAVQDAENKLQRELKKSAKVHTDKLNAILERLSAKIGAEFTTETGGNRRISLFVNLTDRHVETSLLEWGSGTQNRTKILMSLLEATRLRASEEAENKITPIIVVEEPESFLHPSAQAEFGSILQCWLMKLRCRSSSPLTAHIC